MASKYTDSAFQILLEIASDRANDLPTRVTAAATILQNDWVADAPLLPGQTPDTEKGEPDGDVEGNPV